MTLLVKITLVLALLLSIIIPFSAFAYGEKTKKRYKKALTLNVVTFFGMMIIGTVILFTGTVAAADAAAADAASAAASSAGGLATGLGYIAAALVTGFSCIGGGIAVSSAASAALGAISEDQSILGKSLIFVGLAEGIALYGLIISFMILGKL